MPCVTIGIPVYNSRDTLADAIRSVFAQTFDDWELLLVDDGSTDGTLDIARSLDDPRVKVISDGRNMGLPHRLNQIADFAQGEYLARMDADDIMHPERIGAQVWYLDANPLVDVIDTGAYAIDAANAVTGIRVAGPLDSSPRATVSSGLFCHPAVTGRTEWFRRNPYDESFKRAQDYELWSRTCTRSTFARLERPLMYYRESHQHPRAYLRSYLDNSHYRRKCLVAHGPAVLGRSATLMMMLRSAAKGEVYRAATMLGLQGSLIRRRSRGVTDAEYEVGMRDLAAVLSTAVPGLPSVEYAGRRITVLHVSTVASTLFFLDGQTEFMRSKGFDLHALASPGKVLDSFHEEQRIPVYGVEMPRRITPVHDLFALRRMVRIVRQIRPDIVHAHTPKGGLLGTIAAWIARVPIRIYHIRGLPFVTTSGYKRRILTWSERTSCRLATQVLCVSHSVRELLLAEGLCPDWKVKVLRHGSTNGVDAERLFDPALIPESIGSEVRAEYCIPDTARVIGFVGRIVRDKGLTELVEAWRVLRDQYPDLHLLVVGPFEPQDPVPAETEQVLRTDERIHLTGLQEDIPRFYRAMDIVALPTYREGFNNTLLEAAAMELPAVSTLVPGCTDVVVDGVTGTLVPAQDGTALADGLMRYLDDPDLRRRHALNARERVLRDYRPEDMWEAYHRQYLRLLGQPSILREQVAVEED